MVDSWLAATPAVVSSLAGWFVYRHYAVLGWIILSALLLILSGNGAVLLLNTTLITLVIFRAIYDRYRIATMILFTIVTFIKILILIEYYLNEILIYIYYLVDEVFTGYSIALMYLYNFKPSQLGKSLWLLLPASALVSTSTLPLSVLAGSTAALADVSPMLVIALAAFNVYYLTSLGEFLSILPALMLLLSYVLTYKRVLYLSTQPPLGWLYSWLGGRYKVVRLLGIGGFSYVLMVRQKGSVYAAKILRYLDDYGAPLAGDESILRYFGQEMNRYLEIRSDYVVKAFEVYLPAVGYNDMRQYMKNPPYILLEYMEGGTLRDLLRARKRLPPGQVAELFKQLAQGLYEIHKHNIVHLDIKPENIMFTRDRKTAKIGDMGIAKVVTGGYVHSSFMSPAYAAPEVKKGTASFASDIYSLGCVLYEALTGINPNVFIENGYQIPPPSTYAADVPAWMDEIVLKMLSIDPSKRPSAAELVNFISNILESRR